MSIRVIDIIFKSKSVSEPGETMVLLAMADWADDNGICYPAIPQLAEKARMSVRGVRYVLQRLRSRGLVEWDENAGGRYRTNRYFINLEALKQAAEPDEENPANPAPDAPLQNPANPATGDSNPAIGDAKPCKAIAPEPSIEPSILEPSFIPMVRPPDGDRPGAGSIDQPRPSKSRNPPPSRYSENDWNYRAASAMLDRLDSLGALSGVVRKQVKRRGREGIVQEWADVFRLLQEQDGWSQDQITAAMQWLLQRDNKWIQNRWIQSAVALRQRTQGGDKTRFEAIYNQAQNGSGKHKRNGESFDETFQRIFSAAGGAFVEE